MTIERFEIRLACALGLGVWVHLTHDIGYGLWSIGGIILMTAYAYAPYWFEQKRDVAS